MQTSGFVIGGLNTGTMLFIPSALTLKPYNLVSPCMSLVPLTFCPPPGPRVSACEWESMHGPFKRTPWFPEALHLTRTDGIPADIHRQMFCGLPFDTGALGWGTHVSLGPPHSSGSISSVEIPPNSRSSHVGVRPAHLASPPLVLFLM